MSLPPTFVKGFHYEDEVKRMQYSRLGQTHMMVSRISIGGATLCSSYYGERKRRQNSQGRSTPSFCQAYYIATKTGRYDRSGPGQFDFSFERTMKSFDESVKRLGVDYIDLYQLHDVEFADDVDEIINGAFQACLKLEKQGKIKAIGINGYPLSVLSEGLIEGEGKFDTVLTYGRFTLADDSLLDYLPFFAEQKVGIIAASAHGCGLLTNKGPPIWHRGSEKLKAIVAEAAAICRANNVEMGKLATFHLLHVAGNVGTFLLGMEKIEYLNGNLSAYLDGLTDKEKELYETLMRT